MKYNNEIMNQVYMDNRLYGFLLNDSVLFNIATRRLVHYTDEHAEHTMSFKAVSLSETQSRLLTCLLENRANAVIYKHDIMKRVWDELSLSSSSQRLWQTVNELRKKLSFIGLPDDFITNVHGMGYAVNNSKIGSLHIT